MWPTQNDFSILTRFWPLGLWHAVRALRMAPRAVVGITIPTTGGHGVCLRSLKIGILSHTPHDAQTSGLLSPALSILGCPDVARLSDRVSGSSETILGQTYCSVRLEKWSCWLSVSVGALLSVVFDSVPARYMERSTPSCVSFGSSRHLTIRVAL
jgi:hypothetical protein